MNQVDRLNAEIKRIEQIFPNNNTHDCEAIVNGMLGFLTGYIKNNNNISDISKLSMIEFMNDVTAQYRKA